MSSNQADLGKPLTAKNLTGAQAVARVIAEMEEPTVFGMPGGYTVQIFDALHAFQDKVSVNLLRQESLATVMAEARGRLTGSPCVVVGQGAWVLGNAGIGIMEALLGCSPMVLLIDSTDGGTFSHLGPYQAGGGGYGAYDLTAAIRAITKQTFVATSPAQAMQMTRLAFKHATTGEYGPVAVIFNGPSLYTRLDPKREPPTFSSSAYHRHSLPLARESDLQRVAELVRTSKAPVIISGNGVRIAKAEMALLSFANQHSIPVATTPAGKGTFPENHELAVGLIGAFGHASANACVGEADLLIAVGTKLGASDTANQHPQLIDPARQTLIQIDIEPLNLSWTLPIKESVLGDASDALQRLSHLLSNDSFDGKQRTQAIRHAHSYFDRTELLNRGQFSGRDAAFILSEELPDNTIVTCDAGENRLFILQEYQTKEGGTVLQPNGGGGMGYAVPAAMGAAFTFKGRPIVAVCGDGGISMSLHGLLSAIELGLKLTIVVFDNQVLGWIHSSQRNRIIASEFKNFDYAEIARAMGCHAQVATDGNSLRMALREALSFEGVSLVVAKISKLDRYQDVMSSLHKYDIYSVPEAP
jgi:acetolactate synthase-1/2/3 large subunit